MLSQQDIVLIKGLFDEQNEKLEQRFEAIDHRLDGIDVRLDGIDERLDGIDERLDNHDGQFLAIDKRFKETEDRLLRNMLEIEAHLDKKIDHVRDDLSARIDRLEDYYRIRYIEESNQSVMLKMLTDHDRRIEALEKAVI